MFAILAVLLAAQFCGLLYANRYPDTAADQIMRRSLLGYVLIDELRIFKGWDDASDLTRPGLSRDAVTHAVRFRAGVALGETEFAAVILTLGAFFGTRRDS